MKGIAHQEDATRTHFKYSFLKCSLPNMYIPGTYEEINLCTIATKMGYARIHEQSRSSQVTVLPGTQHFQDRGTMGRHLRK